jgi:hypothetical protein
MMAWSGWPKGIEHGVNMTKILSEQIKRKARWVARHYPELSFKDLQQDGAELAHRLGQKFDGKAPLPYLLKAINNCFSKQIRDSRAKRGIRFVGLSKIAEKADESGDREFQNIEDRIDRERFLKTLKNNKLIQMIRDLELGYKPIEIAVRQRTSVRNIYRQLSTVKKLREEWEQYGIDS